MGWVDLVPRAGKLYIGGLYALYQGDLIDKAGITHVLSVIDYDPLLQEKFRHLKQVTWNDCHSSTCACGLTDVLSMYCPCSRCGIRETLPR